MLTIVMCIINDACLVKMYVLFPPAPSSHPARRFFRPVYSLVINCLYTFVRRGIDLTPFSIFGSG